MTRPNQVGGNGKLDIGQVHRLIRLLDEAREIPAERPEREHHLMSGVARIVGAAVAGLVLDTGSGPGARGQRSAMIWIGSDSAALRALERLGQAANALQRMVRTLMRVTPCEPGATVTATWHELATDRWWCCSEEIAQCVRPAGLTDAMFSTLRLRTPSRVHGLGLYRGPGSRSFSEEECNLVQIFHAECEGLLFAPPVDGDGGGSGDDEDHDAVCAPLSPRQRQTLALVLSGLSDKEIAGRLGISRHTVNQYTKTIYRHYGVTSRTQLLARLLVQPRVALPNHRD